MMVSTKGRYALTVMVDLAKNEDGGYVSLSDIAERENLSMKYLESIISILNKGGMLLSLRGKNGGLDLIQVAHRFDDHKVSPGPFAADQDFPEYIICFLKAQ